MELEYKWDLTGPEEMERMRRDPLVASACRGEADIAMDAVYYDTPEGLFAHMGGALRLRRENRAGVCCMKVDRAGEGGCRIREEYEVPAATVQEGLEKLPGAGAPADVCRQAAVAGLVEICRIVYRRNSVTLSVEEDGVQSGMELDFDRGEVRRHGRSAPIREVELEHKEGDVALFHAYASRLEDRFSLKVQEKSKLARAFAL